MNCNINRCSSKFGKRRFQLIHSSNYLIITLKRFASSNGNLIKIHKNIEINKNIILKNCNFGDQKYPLICVLDHLGDTINSDITFVSV